MKASDASIKGETRIDTVARHISFAIARIYSGALLIDFASDSSVANSTDTEVAYRWCCEQPLVDLRWEWFLNERVEADRDIVFDNYSGLQKSKI